MLSGRGRLTRGIGRCSTLAHEGWAVSGSDEFVVPEMEDFVIQCCGKRCHYCFPHSRGIEEKSTRYIQHSEGTNI